MPAVTTLTTVEEFRNLPDPAGGYLELHHGETAFIEYPKKGHKLLQERIRELLNEVLGGTGSVDTGFPFRPLPEHEAWYADVAWLSRERDEAVGLDDDLVGAPDLVVEVLSPSNRVSDMLDKKLICLDNGCREFWVVDPKLQVVEVTNRHGGTFSRRGEVLKSVLVQGVTVDSIFG